MSRVNMPNGLQKKLLGKFAETMNFDLEQMAKICGVHKRTLFDWRREKYQMSYKVLKKLHKVSKVPIPKNIEILPEYWSTKKASRIGAIKRNEIYGSPGTLEGRSKGGKTTQRKFALNPEYAKRIGFIVRREIKQPERAPLLAEFIGIVLGNGTISKYQIKISVNSQTDKKYAYFIQQIIEELFAVSASLNLEKKNALNIVASSINLVEFLLKCGLNRGNKIIQQVDIPKWIMKKKEYMIACLRGLIDTDGGIYFHNHVTKGIRYRHIGPCFTSCSMPLLESVHSIFSSIGISAKNNKKNHVFVYDRKELNKYMYIVGSHNKKHIERFNSYKTSKVSCQ